MNILVIGNGFDLAHGLPTKYMDFLEFIKSFMNCYIKVKNGSMDWLYYDKGKEVNAFLKKWFSAYYQNGQSKNEKRTTVKTIEKFYDNIKDNFWINYFLQCDMHGNENWIDFESEISKMIQSIDADMQGKNLEKQIDELSNEYLTENYLYDGIDSIFEDENGKRMGKQSVSFKNLRDILCKDLNRLIRAFEIYLTEYVGNIEIQKKSPDIEKLEIDKVLSFNYTDTFSKQYKIAKGTEEDDRDSFDYIHGKADINNTIKTNNMVLGIDEYLPDDRKNKDTEFIAFKKFYQRIHKQTGCKYKEWVDGIKQGYIEHLKKIENAKYKELQYIPDKMQSLFNRYAMSAIKREKCQMHNLYIFGHSLDVTDKDILRELILNDNVYTTIFYLNKDVMGQQIANLVKVIGQDELIKRTGGSTKTIEFVPQKPMEPIKEQGAN